MGIKIVSLPNGTCEVSSEKESAMIELPLHDGRRLKISAGDGMQYSSRNEYVCISHGCHLFHFGGSNGMRMKLTAGRFRQTVRLVAGLSGLGFRAVRTRRKGELEYRFIDLPSKK